MAPEETQIQTRQKWWQKMRTAQPLRLGMWTYKLDGLPLDQHVIHAATKCPRNDLTSQPKMQKIKMGERNDWLVWNYYSLYGKYNKILW
jgi:hypothetical protein